MVRLRELRQTVRSTIAHRGRETVAWLAIGGTLVAMLFTAFQVRQGWEERRLAAERSVREQLTTAAVLIGTETARMSGLELRALLWPALSMTGSAHTRALTLDDFAAAGEGVFAAMSDDRGAALPGYFHFARRGTEAWTTETRGALASDSGYAREVLDAVRRWSAGANLDRPDARVGIIHPSVRDVPIIVGIAPVRDEAGHAVALFGVAYARNVALRTHVGHVLRGMSLLPGGAPSPGAGRADNGVLAVRLLHPTGLREGVSPAAADESVWGSRFAVARAAQSPDGGFTVEVAIPEVVGERFVAASMPSASERAMLVGVLLLGIAFAFAAALGVRRQYKLAEARRTFVAAVSHELRTPLAHVNALSETLLMGRAESPEQEQRWLRAIHREGRRLSVLTENVLLHARGERRGIRAAPQWADLAATVQDAVSLVEAQAQSRSARIAIVGSAVDGTAGGAGGWVDAAAVRQIVINFVENALKFGPEGQTVTVTVDIDRSPASGAAGVLRLSVDDEGPGVPVAERERIWKPFVRLADGGNAPAGTGLGLSVVRQLIAELGGSWSVADVPGRGARFSVEIPLAAPPHRGAERAPERAHERVERVVERAMQVRRS